MGIRVHPYAVIHVQVGVIFRKNGVVVALISQPLDASLCLGLGQACLICNNGYKSYCELWANVTS
jgi:hypothetical protein